MKPEARTMLACVACVLLVSACTSATRPDARESLASAAPLQPYMGQVPPGTKAQAFAPGVVNTAAIELNGVFTPDGREFFFARHLDGISTIHHSVMGPDGWSDPVPLDVYGASARSLAVDMAVSPDGNSLYFLGQHPHAGAPVDPTADIWVSQRVDGKWTAADVTPDERTIVFSSRRLPSQGNGDLYVAFRQADGSWSQPASLGPGINTAEHEFCPMATPDGKYLFYSRRFGATWETTTEGEVYWVDMRILEPFRPASGQVMPHEIPAVATR
jgi:Tol biopolymer transport system component